MRTISRRTLTIAMFIMILVPAFDTFGQSATPAAQPKNSSEPPMVIYTSKKYGFRFLLPDSWKGYSVRITEWKGGDGRTYQPDETPPPPAKGPLIVLRHPLWTEAEPRQDIPIMIFTKPQWKLVEAGELILSAAPIGPGELGRNAKYVFALPARYNYALPVGYEEVDDIISKRSLHPIKPR